MLRHSHSTSLSWTPSNIVVFCCRSLGKGLSTKGKSTPPTPSTYRTFGPSFTFALVLGPKKAIDMLLRLATLSFFFFTRTSEAVHVWEKVKARERMVQFVMANGSLLLIVAKVSSYQRDKREKMRVGESERVGERERENGKERERAQDRDEVNSVFYRQRLKRTDFGTRWERQSWAFNARQTDQ